MTGLYRLFTQVYFFLIRLFALWNPKARLMIDGQKDWERKLYTALENKKDRTVIWIHAASLGEFEQGRPVIEKIKQDIPDIFVLLTFFSPSGYEVRKNYDGADFVAYLPFESRRSVPLFYDLVAPSMVIFVKYEFWYYYIDEAKKRNIPTLLISSIFLLHQVFFKFYGGLHRQMLFYFDKIFVQDESSKTLLMKLGIENAIVGGDTRYDRVDDIAKQAKKYAEIEAFVNNRKVALLGSIWPSDMEVIHEGLEDLPEHWCIIIAPHNIDEDSVNDLKKTTSDCVLYSELVKHPKSQAKVLIIDNMGMLSSLYQYGHFAYIGGAFRGALHNTLEAATWGIPVIFGFHEKNKKFREAGELVARKGGFMVRDKEEFKGLLLQITENENLRVQAGKQARVLVESNLGATQKVVSYIKESLIHGG